MRWYMVPRILIEKLGLGGQSRRCLKAQIDDLAKTIEIMSQYESRRFAAPSFPASSSEMSSLPRPRARPLETICRACSEKAACRLPNSSRM